MTNDEMERRVRHEQALDIVRAVKDGRNSPEEMEVAAKLMALILHPDCGECYKESGE